MNRQHGTNACYASGCRQRECVAAHVDYNNHRNRMIAYGRWQALVDATPVRKHLEDLASAGLGTNKVAQITGISPKTISCIRWGRYDDGRGEQQRVRPHIAAAILAVRPGLDSGHGLAPVPGVGVRRRIEALCCNGWTFKAIGEQLGVTSVRVRQLTLSPVVTASTWRKVRDLYERLWDVDGGNKRVKITAARRGFHPAMAWDDATIDDPNAEPCPTPRNDQWEPQHDVDDVAVERALDGRPVRPLGFAERARAVEIGATRRGLSDVQIGRILGIPARTVLRTRQRHNIAPAVPCSRPTTEAAA